MRQLIHECFVSRFPVQAFSRAVVNEANSPRKLLVSNSGEIVSFRKELSQQAIGILIGTTLP